MLRHTPLHNVDMSLKLIFQNNFKKETIYTVLGQEIRRKYRELGRCPSWAVHAKMHWKHAARAAKICAGRANLIE